MKRLGWLVPALAAAALAGQNSGIKREGNYWVDTVTGTAPVREKVEVATTGAITVEGGAAQGVVSYTLKRRVRSGNEAAAREALARVGVKVSERGGVTMLRVPPEASSGELRLQTPRGLRDTVVATSGGAIRAFRLDGALRAETAGGSVEVDGIQGPVVVRTGGGSVRLGRVGGRVQCDSGGGTITADSIGGEAVLNTGGGSISVREAKGFVRARTPGGSIHIERAQAGVEVAAGSGLIDVIEASGPVMAATGSGSIKVRSSSNIHCESGSGAIHLQAVSGGVRASTNSGSIVAELTARLQDSILSTSMGDITVLIPSNLAVTVEATNNTPGGNRIVSDFPEVRSWLERGNAKSGAKGAIHGGGPVLRLTASGGTIYLRRQN